MIDVNVVDPRSKSNWADIPLPSAFDEGSKFAPNLPECVPTGGRAVKIPACSNAPSTRPEFIWAIPQQTSSKES